jgi:hypothetical protein
MHLPFRRRRRASLPGTDVAAPAGWQDSIRDRSSLLERTPRHGASSLALGWGARNVPVLWRPETAGFGALLLAGHAGSGKTVLCRLLCDQAVLAGMSVVVVDGWDRPYPAHTTLSATALDLPDTLRREATPGRCIGIDFREVAHTLPGPEQASPILREALDALAVGSVGAATPTVVILDGDWVLEAVGDETIRTLASVGVWVVLTSQSVNFAKVSFEAVQQTAWLGNPMPGEVEQVVAAELVRPEVATYLANAYSSRPGRGILMQRGPDAVPVAFVVPDDGDLGIAVVGHTRPHTSPVIAPDTNTPA